MRRLEGGKPTVLSSTDCPAAGHTGPRLPPCETPQGATVGMLWEPGPGSAALLAPAPRPALPGGGDLQPSPGHQAAVVEVNLGVFTVEYSWG